MASLKETEGTIKRIRASILRTIKKTGHSRQALRSLSQAFLAL
jgi:hypothetical protein